MTPREAHELETMIEAGCAKMKAISFELYSHATLGTLHRFIQKAGFQITWELFYSRYNQYVGA